MEPDDGEARLLASLVTGHAPPGAEAAHPLVRQAAAAATPERPFGKAGRPLSRRSPFLLAFLGSLGVAAALGLALALTAAGSVLVLIVVAAFFAVGLDPVVTALTDRGWQRRWAVTAVLAAVLALAAGFLAIAVPAISTEYGHLSTKLPVLLRHLQGRHDLIGAQARKVSASTSRTAGRTVSADLLVRAGRTLVSLAVGTVTITVLTCYLLADLPDIKRSAYRLVPRSRRARVGLLTDEILRLVGGYLLGNAITSAAAGLAMFLFLLAVGVPDAAFLGLLVALCDFIPILGAPLAGIVATLVALTVSLPVAIATVAFTLVFRVVEDYLLSPRVMRRTVEIAPVLTVFGVVIGGALLGVVGALLAVPVVASLDLIRKEVLLPSLDGA